MNHYAPASIFIFTLYFGDLKEETRQWNKCFLQDKRPFKGAACITQACGNYLTVLLGWAELSGYLPENNPW